MDTINQIEEGTNNLPATIPPFDITNSVIEVTKLALSMAASDTFLIKAFLLPFLLSRINNDSKHVAAIAPILTMLSITIVIGVSPLFALNLEGSDLAEKHKKLQEALNQLDKKSLVYKIKHKELATNEVSKEIAYLYCNGVIIASGSTCVMTPLMVVSELFLQFIFQQDKAIASIAQDFLRPYAPVIAATFFYLLAAQILISFHYTPAMITSFINCAITVSLAIGLGLGTSLGEKGLLIGYELEAYLLVLINNGYLFFHADFENLNLLSNLRELPLSSCFDAENIKRLKSLLEKSAFLTMSIAGEMAMPFGMAMITGKIGISSQETLALVLQYMSFNQPWIINFPLSSGLLLKSAYRDPKRQHEVYLTAKYGLLTSMVACSIIPLFFAIYPQSLMKLFNNHDENVGQMLDKVAPVFSMGIILDALAYVFLMQLRMIGDMDDVKRTTMFRVGSLFSGLLIAGILGLQTKMGIEGVAVGYVAGMFLGAASLGISWFMKMQQYRDIL